MASNFLTIFQKKASVQPIMTQKHLGVILFLSMP